VRLPALILLLLGVAYTACADPEVPVYTVEVIHAYPHDVNAFTEGLFYLNGFLYESTGLEQHSSIRKVRLETGEVIKKLDIAPQYFGEGIVNWKNHIISLTWKTEVGFVFDLGSFKQERKFSYHGEGWGLTQDGKEVIMSDGTPQLRFLDPETLKETHRIEVKLRGRAVPNVNELEWVKGEIFANVWQTNWILRIDPVSGNVVGVVDLNGLLKQSDIVPGQTDVLNGIAYDARGDRLFITGKNWPKLYEIQLRASLSH
jgi:glutaminyl-peptide cyclotransferase